MGALDRWGWWRAKTAVRAGGVGQGGPFRDGACMEVAMRMDAQFKIIDKSGAHRIEKAVLREAFKGYLPDEILWRQKEQFSDGVGYGWIDGLKAHTSTRVSDDELAAAESRFPINPPPNKER